MNKVKIKSAIEHFNDNREDNEPKLTQNMLGEFVMPDMPLNQSKWYISRWANGEQFGKLLPGHIKLICVRTGFSPNKLLGWDEYLRKNNLEIKK